MIANARAHLQNRFPHEIEPERREMFLTSLIVPLVYLDSEGLRFFVARGRRI